MSKKKRRAQRTRVEPAAAPNLGSPAPRSVAARRVSSEEFEEEYAYVWQDLRRLLVLAAAMFLLLVALNLVLR